MRDTWKNRLLVADDDTMRRGYDNAWHCLFCEAQSANAAKASQHLEQAHTTVLDALLTLEKALTGLTDTQKSLIRRWRDGADDLSLAAERGVSVSTLRNQRFALREREREARLLLAVLSLAGLSTLQKPVKVAKGTGDGVEHFYRDGKLISMPARHAKRTSVMMRFLALFEPGRVYSASEVKEMILPIWPDYAGVRRFLCDAGLLARTVDGSSYWRTTAEPADSQ